MKEETNQMGLMKKLTSAIVASSLVFSMVGTAFAAYTPAAGETAGNRMLGLQILRGKYADDALALKDEITRAELVTVIVRAFGQEANAALLNGAAAYPDTASHWASGNIAMAKALVEKVGGDAIGMPDGSFAPDAKLTPAQAVAFLMKFLGVKADTTKAWPASYLDVAVEKNIITAEDAALLAPMSNDNATRGLVFYLFDRAFASYDLGAGKTFYTKYVDTTAPVVTVNAVAATTLDSKITITGKVEGATEAFVGTTPVTLDANGNFSVDYQLTELKEYNISVTARDLAGNTDEETVTVTRTVGTIASIDAAAITVAAGQTVDVAAAAKDAKGNTIAGVAIAGESTVGTFADGKFTAGQTAGTGKLTLKAGEVTTTVDVTVVAGALAKVETSAASVAPGKSVTVVAKDAFGNTVTGATFSQDSANALLDSTTGTFIATKAGVYTVKATKDGVTAEGKVGVYGAVAKMVVSAPATIVANEETEVTVTATAVDANGSVVLNFDGDVQLDAFDEILTETAEDGVATFEITAPAAYADSEYDLAATFDKDTDTEEWEAGGKGIATIAVEAQVATSIEVAAPEYLISDVDDAGDLIASEVTVTVLDQNGEAMLDGAWEIDLAITGDATFVAGDYDEKSDTVTVTGGTDNVFEVYAEQKGESGDVTVTATFTGMTAGKDTMKMAMPKDPATIVLTAKDNATEVTADFVTVEDEVEGDKVQKVVYTVKVVDKVGVPTTHDTTVSINFDDVDKTALLYVATDADLADFVSMDDEESFDLTVTDGVAKFAVAGQHVDTIKITAKDADSEDDYSLKASSTLSLAVKADAAYYVGLTRSKLNYLQKDNATATVTAQLYDAFGNKVAKEGVEVEFSHEDFDGVKINGKDDTVTVKTDANGVATATVSLATFIDTADITVANDDLEIADGTLMEVGSRAYGSVKLAAVTTIPTTVTVETLNANGDRIPSIQAGTEFYLKVTVKDNYGRAVDEATTEFLTNFGLSLSDSNDDLDLSGVTFSSTDTKGVYQSTGITAEEAETLTLTVKVGKIADTVQGSKSISIKAGDVAAATVAEATSTGLDVTAEKESDLFTLQLTDEFQNLVTSSQVTKSYVVIIEGVDRVENSAGTDVTTDGLLIAAGRTTTKFRLYTETVDSDSAITLTVYAADEDGAATGEAIGSYEIGLK